MIQGLTPMLETPDLPGTKTFYTEVLGFQVLAEDEGWMSLGRDQAEVMFSLPNEQRAIAGPILSGSLYMRTDDADGEWAHLHGRCTVCYPIATFDYGMREFGVFDNNGYLLQFGQQL